MTNIIGISAFYHDSGACLIKDGKILSAVQEERFSRVKNDYNFPKKTIKFILKQNNLKIKDIDFFVFYEKPFLKFNRLLETYLSYAPQGLIQFSKAMPLWIKEKLFQKDIIFRELKKIDGSFDDYSKLKFCDHHLSHAASAFFPSPFENAAILTIDGVGEWTTTSISFGKKNNIEVLKRIKYPHSLGLLYSAFTYFCGFKVNEGEYKLMGLAPYGKPIFYDLIMKQLISVKDDGSFKINLDYFDFCTGSKMTNKKFNNLFSISPRKDNEQIKQIHMDIAASIQKVCEDVVIKMCRYINKELKCDYLCLAGGVALNCVANGKIVKEKIFKDIWIQPAAGDAGACIGAALSYWYMAQNNKRIIKKDTDQMQGSYLGPSYENKEIENFLKKNAKQYTYYNDDDLVKEVARLISDQNVIGWFSGKLEFGPRALGARSIIADPRSEKMQSILNMKVKFRESFRPFAPAILLEDAKYWFNLDQSSPYMLLVTDVCENIRLNVNEEKYQGFEKLKSVRSKIPAVTHVDNSARVQTVDGKTNKKFYNLIREFKKITNVPVIINTSFNIRDEPIVCDYIDAFKCFLFTDIDYLVLENFILHKKDQTS